MSHPRSYRNDGHRRDLPDSANRSRRDFLRLGAAAVCFPGVVGCQSETAALVPGTNRLSARPGMPTLTPQVGASELDFGGARDGLLFVPEAYDPSRAWPLFVALHGATGDADNWRGFFPAGDDRGMVILAPDARGGTWDRIRGAFGPDVAFMDRALGHTFERVRVDPARVCLGGFSDGASYALSLGLSNGDLFNNLIAFSPGFVDAQEPITGKPRVWISHGTADGILPVRLSRDIIVPGLKDDGYDITYKEFAGGHEVPSAVSQEALDWFLG